MSDEQIKKLPWEKATELLLITLLGGNNPNYAEFCVAIKAACEEYAADCRAENARLTKGHQDLVEMVNREHHYLTLTTIERDEARAEVVQLNKALALKLDSMPSGLTAGQSMKMDKERKELAEENRLLRERCERMQEVVSWAQATLTGLNVGDVQSNSPLHLKLREIMIAYRAATPPPATVPTPGKEGGK